MPRITISRRWYLIGIPILVVVLAAGIYLAVTKQLPALKGKAAVITMQPLGKLTSLPGEIIFRFPRSYPGIEGAAISKDSVKNYFTISPALTVQGRWTSDAVFELRCLTPPKPDQTYEVTIFRIPVLSGEVRIPPQTFTFTTPGFELLSAYVRSMRRDQAVLGLDFTYAPVMDKIGKYITVTNSANNELKIWDIQRSHGRPTQILLTLPALKPSDRYKIVVKRGLKCELGLSNGSDLQQTVQAGPTIGPIIVKGHRIEESDYGYTIAVQLSSSDEKGVEVSGENLERFVRISPEIPCRVTATTGAIYLFGDLIPERKYKITLKAGITSKRGSVLTDDYTFDIKIPKSKEKLQFVYRGRYLGRTGEWNLPIKVTGVKKLRMSITYMPSDNVLYWHLNNAGMASELPKMGEAVVTDQEVPIEKGTKSNFAWIDLKQYLKGDEKGVFLVEASGETQSHGTLTDRIAVVISDLSVVLKWQKHNIYAWCYNSATLKPESGVEIEVRSAKNFIAGKGTTGGDGFCLLPMQREDREPYIVFARRGDEWTYVHVPTVRLPLDAYDIGGDDPAMPYLAYLYPERDLYRPGDMVHFSVIVRNNGNYKGAAIPVKVKVRDPEGKDFVALSGTTDENGFAEFSFPTTPSSPTGKYMLEVLGGDKSIYSASIFVEAFVPERMNVAIGIPDKIRIDEPFDLSVKADFLFGAPASGERFSGKVKASEVDFTAPGYGNYLFGQVRLSGEKPGAWEQDLDGGTLDAKGQGSEQITIDTTVSFNGPVRVDAQVSVTEGGSGRVTSRSLSKTIYSKPFYIGIRPTMTRIVPGQPVDVRGVLLKPDGTPYAKETVLQFCAYRLSYHYNYEEGDDEGEGYYDYSNWNVRNNKVPVIPQKPVDVTDGKFTCSFTPQSSEYDYLIEVVNEDHQAVAEAQINGWGWRERAQQSPRVESPEVIPLRLDKAEYDENDQVKVEALLPFDGDILWTVELDTLYTWEMHPAKGELASWSFKAPPGVANVYVSALLVRSGGNYLVQRGLGVQRVKIRPSSHKLALTVDVPGTVKPGEDLTVTVKGDGKYRATIAVVDEGILQITDFATPDPYQALLRNLALTLDGAESFGWIIRKFLDRTGGDMAAKEKEFPQARFARIVSSWSGLKSSGPDGTIKYTIHIPEYNGKLRVMVAGASSSGFGGAHANVVVESEVIVTPTIPRFGYTADECVFPVTLINTTAYKRTVSLSVGLKNGSLSEALPSEIALEPGGKQVAWVPCKVGTDPGSMAIDITAKSKNERYHDSFEIPIYPNTPYITESEYSVLAPHQSLDLKAIFDDWYPRAHHADLLTSPVLGLTRLNHARYVVHYPYGCIEQSSTSTLVLLRLSSLWGVLSPNVNHERYLDMVNYGIHRIMSMQTVSGGFSYWPGESEPNEWGTGYATFVLMEAKAAGFTVPEGVISNALEYLDNVYSKTGMINYVLARGRRLQRNPEAIDRLITLSKKDECSLQDLLLNAGAAFECGRTTEAKEILALALAKKVDKQRHYSGDYYSYLQNRGMALYFIELVNPGTPDEARLVQDLAENLADRYSWYYSTEDLAWTMLSLGIFAEHASKNITQAVLSIDGKAVKPVASNNLWSWRLENPGKAGRVKLENPGDVELYLNIENTGFSKKQTAFTASSKGIGVDRTILSYDGNAITRANQGDLVVMLIQVDGYRDYYRTCDNCAVEVQIPAGFEIENPRLGRGDLPSWAKEDRLWNPQYVDIRDDRVVIFGQVNSYQSQYYYVLARAVTPGKFFLPPVNAIVMYQPEYNAHTQAGIFEINRR